MISGSLSSVPQTGDSMALPNSYAIRVHESLDNNMASTVAHGAAPLQENNNLWNEYRYLPLSYDRSIRLLRLMPHRDKQAPIHCRIFEYPLQEAGEGVQLYEALSYVWGSEAEERVIHIHSDEGNDGYAPGGNCCLPVRPNLHAALSHLRDRFIERVIWIDAICINQKDDEEKGQQVQSMAEIYAKASRVIVWLGDATAEDQGDRALRKIFEAAQKQQADSLSHESYQQSQWQDGSSVPYDTDQDSEGQSIDETYQDYTDQPIEEADYQPEYPAVDETDQVSQNLSFDEAVHEPEDLTVDEMEQQVVCALLQRPWFERIWVSNGQE
jgi:hypothetical protein